VNLDPLAPLRALPETVRAYYYRIAAALLLAAVATVAAFNGPVEQVAQIGGAALGLGAAVLAVANTETTPAEPQPRDPDDGF